MTARLCPEVLTWGDEPVTLHAPASHHHDKAGEPDGVTRLELAGGLTRFEWMAFELFKSKWAPLTVTTDIESAVTAARIFCQEMEARRGK